MPAIGFVFSADHAAEGPTTLHALDPAVATTATVVLEARGTVTYLAFDRSLEDLQLDAGANRRVPGEEGRSLAPFLIHAEHSRRDGGDSAPWRPLDLDGEEALRKALHVAHLDWDRCVKAGGCAESAAASGACARPCPAAAPPREPELTACPRGWTRVETQEDLRCQAPAALPAGAGDCAAGGGHPLPSGCTPIGPPPCGAGEWAPDLPNDGRPVLHVRAGAASGSDGSRDRPFATFSGAIQEAAAAHQGPRIRLADGRIRNAPIGMIIPDRRPEDRSVYFERVHVAENDAPLGR